jgi:hypothetical protein
MNIRLDTLHISKRLCNTCMNDKMQDANGASQDVNGASQDANGASQDANGASQDDVKREPLTIKDMLEFLQPYKVEALYIDTLVQALRGEIPVWNGFDGQYVMQKVLGSDGITSPMLKEFYFRLQIARLRDNNRRRRVQHIPQG